MNDSRSRLGDRGRQSGYRQIGAVGVCLFVVTFWIGCAVAPQPEVEVYLEPIAGHFDAHIDPETGAATVEKSGIAVTIKPFDEVALFALTEDPRINPYLSLEERGAVEPIYTVFDITVHNREHRRVLFEDRAILIDSDGTQYANLSLDYFDTLYADVGRTQPPPTYMPTPYSHYPYHGYYRSYIDHQALELGHTVIEETLLESGKLFSGAKRSGFLIFDRLESVGTDLRVVIPHVRIVHPNGKVDPLEFKLDFRQVLP